MDGVQVEPVHGGAELGALDIGPPLELIAEAGVRGVL
jgi:hypothetical protein